MLDNEKVKGVHATRWIMSWLRMGGELMYGHQSDDFNDWLISEGVSESDRDLINDIARNGKMELETSAGRFIKQLKSK